MSKTALSVLTAIALIIVTISGIFFYNNRLMPMKNNNINNNDNNNKQAQNNAITEVSTHDYAKGLIKPKAGQSVKKFVIAAQEGKHEIKKGLYINAWTFNGKVPGPEIRVTQGDFVQVTVKNYLKEPVTIHWHGYPLLSAMDGVPGWNQDAIRTGETFTYEFSADVAGTYWYHSHQQGAEQVDKGLYGALIVEPRVKEKIDRDYTFIIDETMENPMDDMDSMPGMSGNSSSQEMNMPGHGGGDSNTSEEEMMGSLYNIYTINGKSGELISPIEARLNDVVRLRFINSGYRSHGVHIPGQDIKVVSTDGQDINGAGIIKDQVINVAPGERYDIEFTVTSKDNFVIDFHDNNKYNDQLKIPVNITGGSGKALPEEQTNLPLFDLVAYGKPGTGKFTLTQKYDIDYNVELGTKMDGKTQKYTINGSVFEELPSLIVKTGDLVKMTYVNKTDVDHPMHLHGHFFEVIAKNGMPVTGAAIVKDTLLIKPGESYTVAFKADNVGRWVQHCHELHHAAAGMMQKVEYIDFKPNYIPDPNKKFNKPE